VKGQDVVTAINKTATGTLLAQSSLSPVFPHVTVPTLIPTDANDRPKVPVQVTSITIA
jgi:hypothetical protein